MTGQEPQDWDPRAPEVLADQRAAFDTMRNQCPVAYSDAMKWSIFRHADVMTVLDDPDTFINSSRHHAIPNAMNGDEHTSHRAMLAHYFEAEELGPLESRSRAIAAEVIGALDVTAPVDAANDIAEPIALRIMCAFLGWPDHLWVRVRDWIHGNREATFRRDREAGARLAAEYAAIVTEAIEDHRQRNITTDVMGRLMQTDLDGHRWTDQEVIDTLRNWIAGHGTTSAMIGIILAHLADDQSLQQRLRSEPDLVPLAIEEIPRTDGPLVSNSRTTSRSVELGGREIPAGERLSLMWIAANRDPATFDQPDQIDLNRSQQDNLLYGAGIHYCLGAPLSRLEARVVVEELLASTTGFALAQPGPLARETWPGNGFMSIPVRLEVAQ